MSEARRPRRALRRAARGTRPVAARRCVLEARTAHERIGLVAGRVGVAVRAGGAVVVRARRARQPAARRGVVPRQAAVERSPLLARGARVARHAGGALVVPAVRARLGARRRRVLVREAAVLRAVRHLRRPYRLVVLVPIPARLRAVARQARGALVVHPARAGVIARRARVRDARAAVEQLIFPAGGVGVAGHGVRAPLAVAGGARETARRRRVLERGAAVERPRRVVARRPGRRPHQRGPRRRRSLVAPGGGVAIQALGAIRRRSRRAGMLAPPGRVDVGRPAGEPPHRREEGGRPRRPPRRTDAFREESGRDRAVRDGRRLTAGPPRGALGHGVAETAVDAVLDTVRARSVARPGRVQDGIAAVEPAPDVRRYRHDAGVGRDRHGGDRHVRVRGALLDGVAEPGGAVRNALARHLAPTGRDDGIAAVVPPRLPLGRRYRQSRRREGGGREASVEFLERHIRRGPSPPGVLDDGMSRCRVPHRARRGTGSAALRHGVAEFAVDAVDDPLRAGRVARPGRGVGGFAAVEPAGFLGRRRRLGGGRRLLLLIIIILLFLLLLLLLLVVVVFRGEAVELRRRLHRRLPRRLPCRVLRRRPRRVLRRLAFRHARRQFRRLPRGRPRRLGRGGGGGGGGVK